MLSPSEKIALVYYEEAKKRAELASAESGMSYQQKSMGKRDHGRLVQEIRTALINSGFEPSRITQMESAEGTRAVRSPGFKVEKHTDSKSVRLSYRVPRQPSGAEMSWHTRQSVGSVLMRKLVRYNATLEQAGFTCIAINSRDPLAPYSLWRRTPPETKAG